MNKKVIYHTDNVLYMKEVQRPRSLYVRHHFDMIANKTLCECFDFVCFLSYKKITAVSVAIVQMITQ